MINVVLKRKEVLVFDKNGKIILDLELFLEGSQFLDRWIRSVY